MLTRLLLYFCLLFQILSGCASYLVVSGGAVNRDKLQEIKSGIAALRGLDFRSDVPVEIKNKEEMRRYFEAELAREYGDEKLRNMVLAYSKLGLLPKGFDLKKSLLDFYSAQVAAFYDPEEKKLVLPEDFNAGVLMGSFQFMARRDIVGEMVLAHELTHALQDQNFELKNKMGPSNNDDKTLSFRAVVEGDATVSGFEYLFGFTDEASLAQVNRELRGRMDEARSGFSEIPKAILEGLLFQYYGGVSFISRVLSTKGWAGVNLLYSAPPLSTKQVLHPEKFFDPPDPPTEVVLKDLSALFSPDWEEIENNVLGELMVQVLFEEFFTEKEAKMVAAGWGGDRFVAFRSGDEVSFIWVTVWDSPKDADEFLQGYTEILAKKYGDSGAATSHAYIEQREDRVVVVEGLERTYVKNNLEKIWQGMELKRGVIAKGPS